jgi:hypothetical protein
MDCGKSIFKEIVENLNVFQDDFKKLNFMQFSTQQKIAFIDRISRKFSRFSMIQF